MGVSDMPPEYEECLQVARAELKSAKAALNLEISGYPTPISGCDAQFNHLLAQRQKVLEALRSLETPVFVPTPRTPTPISGVESR